MSSDEKPTTPKDDLVEYRAAAQQNSMDAIRAAEERYAKAKQSGAAALSDAKESAVHGLGAATTYVAAKAVDAKDTAVHGAHIAAAYASKKAVVVKDTAIEKGRTAVDYTGQKAVEVKDSALTASRKAVEYTGEKAVEATDAVLNAGRSATAKGKTTEESDECAMASSQIKVLKLDNVIRRTENDRPFTADVGCCKRCEPSNAATYIGPCKHSEGAEEVARELGELVEKQEKGLLETVGEKVISIAQTAKEIITGRDPSHKG